jgi:cobalamin biosynthesis protein CobT
MSEPTNQEIKELLLAFEKKVDLSLSDMNRLMEVGFAELNRKIDVGLSEVRGEITRVEEKLTGEIKRLDTEIKVVQVEVKSVEANLSAKLDGLGKRVENQEFVSRGATVALVGGLVTGMVKLLFFPDRLP